MLKLKAGRYYRTRDGRRAYVAALVNPFKDRFSEDTFPVCGWIDQDDFDPSEVYCWSTEGRFGSQLDSRDIVGEWIHPRKGKAYIYILETPSKQLIVRSSFTKTHYDNLVCAYQIDWVEGEEFPSGETLLAFNPDCCGGCVA